MSVSFYLKRSSTASKRPVASALAYGELALNYDSGTGGIYYRDSSESVIKVGPAQVSNSAPNSTPSGSPGNSVGEFWYDTINSALKVWDGSAWVPDISKAPTPKLPPDMSHTVSQQKLHSVS